MSLKHKLKQSDTRRLMELKEQAGNFEKKYDVLLQEKEKIIRVQFDKEIDHLKSEMEAVRMATIKKDELISKLTSIIENQESDLFCDFNDVPTDKQGYFSSIRECMKQEHVMYECEDCHQTKKLMRQGGRAEVMTNVTQLVTETDKPALGAKEKMLKLQLEYEAKATKALEQYTKELHRNKRKEIENYIFKTKAHEVMEFKYPKIPSSEQNLAELQENFADEIEGLQEILKMTRGLYDDCIKEKNLCEANLDVTKHMLADQLKQTDRLRAECSFKDKRIDYLQNYVDEMRLNFEAIKYQQQRQFDHTRLELEEQRDKL